MRQATLADVADSLGVSIPTVSRALRGSSEISDTTKSRIRAKAEELGYVGSAAARALRTGRHRAIGFTLPVRDIGWWERLIKGASETAAAYDYSLVLYPTQDRGPGDSSGATQHSADMRSSSEVVEALVSSPVDALLLVTPGERNWLDRYIAGAKPVLVIDDTAVYPGINSWSSDNYGGARMAVEHLASIGRRRIVCVNPRAVIGERVATERIRGFRDAAGAAGVDAWVVDTAETYPISLTESDAVKKASTNGIDFDAVFCLADFTAPAVFRAIAGMGKTIPDDVAVIGFDNDQAGMAVSPMLTTIEQPLEEIGRRAVRHAIEMLDDPDRPIEDFSLPTRIIRRGSA
jgi:LacI family transcriptional regulator